MLFSYRLLFHKWAVFDVFQYIMIATEDVSSFCIGKDLSLWLIFSSLELIHVGHVSA
jgi:hypothetical protein